MDTSTLVQLLDSPREAASWLTSVGIEDVERAHTNLVRMAKSGMTLDLLASICDQLSQHLGLLAIQIWPSTVWSDSWSRPGARSRSVEGG